MKSILRLAFFCLLLCAVTGVASEKFDVAWKTIHDSQPRELALKLSIARTNFYQGEIIPATLLFTNTSTNHWHLWAGTYDRSGRIRDIAFRAETSRGAAVPDPLEWYFKRGGIAGGLGDYQNIGGWNIPLIANQWLRFDSPGTYRLYASSSRPASGWKEESRTNTHHTNIVSDVVTITITPLTKARENELLAQGKVDLQRKDGSKESGAVITQLIYLQTPAARALLMPAVDYQGTASPWFAFIGAPNPRAEADALRKFILAPQNAVTSAHVWLIGSLEQGVPTWSEKLLAKVSPTLVPNWSQRRLELLSDLKAALPAKKDVARVTTLKTLVQELPNDLELRQQLPPENGSGSKK